MTHLVDNRIKVLLVNSDPHPSLFWVDLFFKYRCTVRHISLRDDGLYANLFGADFDLMILSLNDPEDLARYLSFIPEVLPYLPELLPYCILIPRVRFQTNDGESGRAGEDSVIAVPRNEIDDTLRAAIHELENGGSIKSIRKARQASLNFPGPQQ
ncbi:MAG: hypothetical protein LAO21_08800 [Acidobacteriia bacterium]|nr:hypothetical protein [Terriglobia bacterium]